jgi:7-cyano-7-deazaguanine synthase
MKNRGKRAVVLLSGGLDSATTLYYARAKGYQCFCLIMDYGQRHGKEVQQARAIARRSGSDYRVVKIVLPWRGSALLDKKISVPLDQRILSGKIPVTYVPARNIIFLSYAASYAETIGAKTIFIGANAVDFSGYPDCRPQFFQAMQEVLRSGLKTSVEGKRIAISTPLIHKTKAEIIKLGSGLGVPYQLTWSCYQGGRRPCGKCDSCQLRQKGFSALGLKDPAR